MIYFQKQDAIISGKFKYPSSISHKTLINGKVHYHIVLKDHYEPMEHCDPAEEEVDICLRDEAIPLAADFYDPKIPDEVLRFRCVHCDEYFTTKSAAQRHLKSRNGNPPACTKLKTGVQVKDIRQPEEVMVKVDICDNCPNCSK